MQEPLFTTPNPTSPAGALLAVVSPLVVNVATKVPCDVYVGRSFAGRVDEGFGNPIKMTGKSDAARADVIVRYWEWLLRAPGAAAVRERLASGELSGKVLGCWCSPKGCHGHVLAGIAAGKEDLVEDWIAHLRILRRL